MDGDVEAEIGAVHGQAPPVVAVAANGSDLLVDWLRATHPWFWPDAAHPVGETRDEAEILDHMLFADQAHRHDATRLLGQSEAALGRWRDALSEAVARAMRVGRSTLYRAQEGCRLLRHPSRGRTPATN
jgi:hypothetical protein